MSSGEAEPTAGGKASSASLGIKSLGADRGQELKVNVRADSTASKGISGRRGADAIRHLRATLLRVQQKRAQQELMVKNVPGEENPADLGTKELARQVMERHPASRGFFFRKGVRPRALAAQLDSRRGEGGGLSGCSGDRCLKDINGALLQRETAVLAGVFGGRFQGGGRGSRAPIPGDRGGGEAADAGEPRPVGGPGSRRAAQV